MNTEQIKVEYLDHMGSDLTVVNAARTSFGKESWWADVEKMTLKDGDAGLIRYLATGYRTQEWDEFLDEIMGYALRYDRDAAKVLLTNALHAYKRRAQHWAPFAHPHIEIRVQMPIFLARQFVKHQVGGVWSEESRRYMSSEPEFWFPDEWHGRPENIKQGSDGLIEYQDEARGYAEDVVSLALEKYILLQDLKVAPEEARIVLPLNTMTVVTWTGSLLFWSRVRNQRVDSHAQLAAQELGKKISSIMQPLFPVSWAALVG